ncbi:MAG: LOG family protein [Melioribacteraceae bacterium]|nr:LOG family protein [Melioribacteraceae bacterium]
MSKTVTIFGSSLPVPGEKEYEDAYNIALILCSNGFNICNGGYQGVMDATAKAAKENKTEAFGITVPHFSAKVSEHLTKVIYTDTLFERISKLIEIADAFVVLAGGTGTLLELSAIWEFMNKRIIPIKPIAVYGDIWGDLISIMDERMIVEKRQTGLINYFDDLEACSDFIITSLKK